MKEGKFNHPYLDNLVGITGDNPEQKDKIGKFMEKIVYEEGHKPIENFEIEKTQKDLEILAFAEKAASEIIKEYGRQKDVKVPMEFVHLLRPGGTQEYTEGRLTRGAHSQKSGGILIDRDSSNIEFSLTAFHEFLHLKSYKSLQIIFPRGNEKNFRFEAYRSGMTVVSRDGKREYFTDLEEAIVSLLTERFFEKKVKLSPIFKDELEKERKNVSTSRQQEMQKLYRIIDEIFIKNQNEFTDREEVLGLFIKAQISGNLLRVGRLIEKTFGKGSFRKIGKGE